MVVGKNHQECFKLLKLKRDEQIITQLIVSS